MIKYADYYDGTSTPDGQDDTQGTCNGDVEIPGMRTYFNKTWEGAISNVATGEHDEQGMATSHST